jgi:tetratricopeptide (TPR) repeat protein
MEYGRILRQGFHQMLPKAAEGIELEDREELRPYHADFLSRLGMTFHRGDYSRLEEVQGKTALARRLYIRALNIHADPRAFLGLAMLEQQSGALDSAEKTLRQGLERFPEDAPLAICLGVLLMNQARFKEAMELLGRFPDKPEIRPYLDECRRRLRM